MQLSCTNSRRKDEKGGDKAHIAVFIEKTEGKINFAEGFVFTNGKFYLLINAA